MDLVLGELCGINKNRSINPTVDHCCKTNFAFRRSCFEGLEADKTYVPLPPSQGLFTFPPDLCQAHNEELQRKKDRYTQSLLVIFFFNLKTQQVFMRRFLLKDMWCWCYNPVPSVSLSSLSNYKLIARGLESPKYCDLERWVGAATRGSEEGQNKSDFLERRSKMFALTISLDAWGDEKCKRDKNSFVFSGNAINAKESELYLFIYLHLGNACIKWSENSI